MKPDCKNCRFFVPGRYARTDTCTQFIIYRGRGKLLYDWAESARFSFSKCGPDGKLFIARKDVQPIEPQIKLSDILNDI
jgi:hypothetical protein